MGFPLVSRIAMIILSSPAFVVILSFFLFICQRKSYDKTNMDSIILRRFLVVMLLMYCCVTTALPLSYIHIESMPSVYSYVCGQDHPEGDIHIRLHELFFSHFSNRSDHIRNIASVQLIKHKTGGNREHLQPAIAADTPHPANCFGSYVLTSYCAAHHDKSCLYFSVSGLSPPSS